jgi:hypothetical protein
MIRESEGELASRGGCKVGDEIPVSVPFVGTPFPRSTEFNGPNLGGEGVGAGVINSSWLAFPSVAGSGRSCPLAARKSLSKSTASAPQSGSAIIAKIVKDQVIRIGDLP